MTCHIKMLTYSQAGMCMFVNRLYFCPKNTITSNHLYVTTTTRHQRRQDHSYIHPPLIKQSDMSNKPWEQKYLRLDWIHNTHTHTHVCIRTWAVYGWLHYNTRDFKHRYEILRYFIKNHNLPWNVSYPVFSHGILCHSVEMTVCCCCTAAIMLHNWRAFG